MITFMQAQATRNGNLRQVNNHERILGSTGPQWSAASSQAGIGKAAPVSVGVEPVM